VGAAPGCALLPVKWESSGDSLHVSDSRILTLLAFVTSIFSSKASVSLAPLVMSEVCRPCDATLSRRVWRRVAALATARTPCALV